MTAFSFLCIHSVLCDADKESSAFAITYRRTHSTHTAIITAIRSRVTIPSAAPTAMRPYRSVSISLSILPHSQLPPDVTVATGVAGVNIV